MITLTPRCQFKSSTRDKVLVLRHSGCPWERHTLRVAHTEPGLLSPLLELWCTPSLTPLPFLKGLLCRSTSYISMPAPQPSLCPYCWICSAQDKEERTSYMHQTGLCQFYILHNSQSVTIKWLSLSLEDRPKEGTSVPKHHMGKSAFKYL